MKIKTANTSYIGLPICPTSFFNTSTVNITIDWGDSTTESFSSLSHSSITQVNDGSGNVIANIFTHNYSSEGIYTITINGGFGSVGNEKLAFVQQSKQSNGDAEDISESLGDASLSKITEIEGESNFYIHGQGDFKGFTNLTTIDDGASALLSDAPASSIVLSSNSSATMLMDKTFEDCSSLTEMDFTPENLTSAQYTFKNSSYSPNPAWKIHDNWDMSNVVSARGMFEGSSFNGYVSKFDMSSVQDCSAMFKNTSAFNQWVDSWFNGTNSLTNTSSMFEGAEAFNNKVASWNLDGVQNASAMFKNTKVFNKWIDPWFDGTNSLTNTSSMFEGAEAFNNKVASWNLDGVQNASAMFKNTKVFNKWVDSLFDGSPNALTDISSIFEGAEAFNNKVASWKLDGVQNASAMFKNAKVFDKWVDSLFDASSNSVTNTSSIFEGAEAFNNKVASWNLDGVEDASAMFKDTKVFNKWVDSLFDGSSNSVTNISAIFQSAQAFNNKVASWNLDGVEDASAMFKDTKVFNKWVDSLFDGSSNSVTNISSIFEGAEAFNNKVASWNLDAVEDASAMFKNTKRFNKWVDSLFDGSSNSVTNMSSMFEGAEAFDNKVESWNLVSVEDVSFMFKNAKVFNQAIDSWFEKDDNKTYALTNMKSIFENSEVDQDISNWDISNVSSENLEGFATGATGLTASDVPSEVPSTEVAADSSGTSTATPNFALSFDNGTYSASNETFTPDSSLGQVNGEDSYSVTVKPYQLLTLSGGTYTNGVQDTTTMKVQQSTSTSAEFIHAHSESSSFYLSGDTVVVTVDSSNNVRLHTPYSGNPTRQQVIDAFDNPYDYNDYYNNDTKTAVTALVELKDIEHSGTTASSTVQVSTNGSWTDEETFTVAFTTQLSSSGMLSYYGGWVLYQNSSGVLTLVTNSSTPYIINGAYSNSISSSWGIEDGSQTVNDGYGGTTTTYFDPGGIESNNDSTFTEPTINT